MKIFPICEVDNVKTFTFNILDWGITKFDHLLIVPVNFWIELGLYNQITITKREIVEYLDRKTNGFTRLYAKAAYDDMASAYEEYLSKIKRVFEYVLWRYKSQYKPLFLTGQGIEIFDKIQYEYPSDKNSVFPQILSPAEDCIKALDLDNSLYEYAHDVLREAAGIKTNLPATSGSASLLPPELDTPQAREYFKKAQEAGFIAKTSTGYKWVTDNKSECSLFCDLCSDALKLSKSENRTSWKPFAALFGYKAEALREAKNGRRNKCGPPARHREIEAIFK